MRDRRAVTGLLGKTALALLILIPWGMVLSSLLPLSPAQAQPAAAPPAKDDEELTRLYTEDQADREPPEGKSIDWSVVAPRDTARLARVKQLYSAGRLQTGADYFHAAMVLQHSEIPEDYLLAHELCVVAISKGEKQAVWLAAASEDRFLMNIKRPQRFGTQFHKESSGPWQLYTVDSGVTDALREAMGVRSLAKAREREAEMNQKKTDR